jgi:hypothetical protein
MAQVSEFSFILMALALTIGHITDTNITSVVTIVGLITIAGSSYYLTYATTIYTTIKPYLKYFEAKKLHEDKIDSDKKSYDIIVFGNHRTGDSIVHMLQENKKNFSIIDYDPQVIEKLERS